MIFNLHLGQYLLPLLVVFHQALHFPTNSYYVVVYKVYFVFSNVQLLAVLKIGDGQIDLLRYLESLSHQLGLLLTHYFIMVIHMAVVCAVYLAKSKQQISILQFTLHFYCYLLIVPIYRDSFQNAVSPIEVFFKILNLLACLTLQVFYLLTNCQDNFYENEPFLQGRKFKTIEVLQHLNLLVILVIDSNSSNKAILRVLITAHFCLKVLNFRILEDQSVFSSAVLGLLAMVLQFEGSKSAALVLTLIIIPVYVFMNSYVAAKEQRLFIKLQKVCNFDENALIFLQKFQIVLQTHNFSGNKDKYEFYSKLINLKTLKEREKQILYDLTLQNREIIRIVNVYIFEQPVNAFRVMEVAAPNMSFYDRVASQSIKFCFHMSHSAALREEMHQLLIQFSEVEIGLINQFKQVLLDKVRIFKQLLNPIMKPSDFLSLMDDFGYKLGKLRRSLRHLNMNSNHVHFVALLYHFAFNDPAKGYKLKRRTPTQEMCKVNPKFDIVSADSVIISVDFSSLNRIEQKQLANLKKFFGYPITTIKELMPRFIAERHDDFMRNVTYAQNQLLTRKFNTFYRINQRLEACEVRLLNTIQFDNLSIVLTKQKTQNTFILFDMSGQILYADNTSRRTNIHSLMQLKKEIAELEALEKKNGQPAIFNKWGTLKFASEGIAQQEATSILPSEKFDLYQSLNTMSSFTRFINFNLYKTGLGSGQKFEFYVMEVMRDSENQSNTDSEGSSRIIEKIKKLNTAQEPKFIEARYTQKTINNQSFVKSPNQSQIQFFPRNPSERGSTLSQSSSLHTNHVTQLENAQITLTRQFKLLGLMVTLMLILFYTILFSLLQSQLKLQITNLQQVAHVQSLSQDYLTQFYFLLMIKLDTKFDLQLNQSQINIPRALQQVLLKDRMISSEQIFVLNKKVDAKIQVGDSSASVYEFYHRFYQSLLNDSDVFSSTYIEDLIVFNDETIDEIVTQVDSDFQSIQHQVFLCFIVAFPFVVVLLSLVMVAARQLHRFSLDLLQPYVYLDHRTLGDEIVKYEGLGDQLSNWQMIQPDEQEGKEQEQRVVANRLLGQAIEEIRFPQKQLAILTLLIVLPIGVCAMSYYFLVTQAQQFQMHFSFNYKSVQIQQHFMCTIVLGDVIKANYLLDVQQQESIFKTFFEHFVYLIPSQIYDLLYQILSLNIQQNIQDYFKVDLCRQFNLDVCQAPQRQGYSDGIQGYASQLLTYVQSEFLVESSQRKFVEDKEALVRYFRSENHKTYMIYYILEIQQILNSLITYSYNYLQQKYDSILEIFWISLTVLLVSTLLWLFQFMTWIKRQDALCLNLLQALRILPKKEVDRNRMVQARITVLKKHLLLKAKIC